MSNTPYPDDAESWMEVVPWGEELYLGPIDDAESFKQAEPWEEKLDLDPIVNGSVCQNCLVLRLPDPRRMDLLPESRRIDPTYAELQRTATDGCWLCKLLQQVSETACTGADTVIQDTNVVHATPGFSGSDGCPAYVEVRRGYHIYPTLFYAASGDSCPWPFMTKEYIPDASASIQDCARTSHRMLDTCNNTHPTCKASDLEQISGGLVTPQFIPKRLLHISRDYLHLQVRLHETSSGETSLKGVDLRYTALSHCWGSIPIITTTTVTMPTFKNEGIRWKHLPKTFQEAILLTRELGVNYIWIDSLCILQDSVNDWAHEASQMAKIFSNSYLTIGASAAENGHQGLLNRRSRTAQISDAVHRGESTAVFVRNTIHHEFVEKGLVPFKDASDLPLRKRAWCFQEELLSIRMIHFTQDEVVFICREATTCECDPSWLPRFNLPPIVGTSLAEPSEIWQNIVKHYTERQISFCKDRLPALSSLTQSFEEGSGRYLAGLWESHLPGSLLWWSQCGKRPEQEQDSTCRPPSWSWASIEGVVNHPPGNEDDHKDIAEVLDVRTCPSTVDPRGMVSGGQITLRAPLFPLKKTWKMPESPWQTFVEWHSGDSSFDSCFACSPGWVPELDWSEEEDCYCMLDDPANPLLLLPDHAIDTPIFLLIICTLEDDEPTEDLPHYKGYRFLGLLLQPLEDLNQTQMKAMEDSESKLSFVRIGFGGMCLSKEDGEEALNRFGNTIVTIF